MARICKNCGNAIKFKNGDEAIFCTGCEREIIYSDTMAYWTFISRVAQLKAMHELMHYANDEEIYMTWIVTGVPDEPSEDDFEYIALDDRLYNECFDLFIKLIKDENNRW